jgi:hypothetical protein
MADPELTRILDGIADAVVTRADSYQKVHDQLKRRALEIYYSFVGQFTEDEKPAEDWQSKLYPKILKPKIMAAWSQFVQAATSSKHKWEVQPRNTSTRQASTAATGMKNRMHEQAESCGLDRKLKSGSMDSFLYGTMFMQSPIVETKQHQSWVMDLGQSEMAQAKIAFRSGHPIEAGRLMMQARGKQQLAAQQKPIWTPQFDPQDTPSVIHRNYFEMYPWPYSSDIQAGEGIIHRPFIDKYELSMLRDEPGYYKDVIDELLRLEPGSPPSWSIEQDMMGARGWMNDSKRKGYDLIFFAGRLNSKDLKMNQVQGFEEDKSRFAEVLVWVINHSSGKKVIKLIPNPIIGKHRPFLMAHYEQMPYESMGVGIGENSVDMAKSIGAAVRLFMDGKKMALPMIGINTSYFSGSTEIEFSPFKIWPFDKEGINPQEAMFPIKFADVTTGMVEFIEVLERLHDEITGIPKWTTGVDSKMLNKTATGISMIMNASSQLIRGAIENMDDYILTPIGQRFYDWNMKNSKDGDIKGDFIVNAAGLSTLMQKETLNQQLLGLLSLVVNPQVMQSPFALRLLRQVADNMGEKDVDSILPNPDKMQNFADQDPRAAAASLQPSAPPQPSPQQIIEQAKLNGVAKGMEDRMHDIVAGGGEPGAGNGGMNG